MEEEEEASRVAKYPPLTYRPTIRPDPPCRAAASVEVNCSLGLHVGEPEPLQSHPTEPLFLFDPNLY